MSTTAEDRSPGQVLCSSFGTPHGIVRDFKQAWEANDIDALIGLLDPDATVIADGGGLVSATLLLGAKFGLSL